MTTWTPEQYAEHQRKRGFKAPPSATSEPAIVAPPRLQSGVHQKYGAKQTTVDGILFASKREAAHYEQLKLRQCAGEISGLVADKERLRYPLKVNDVLLGYYEADFSFTESVGGRQVVADAKGMKTPIYVIKRKLMKALYSIDILEL